MPSQVKTSEMTHSMVTGLSGDERFRRSIGLRYITSHGSMSDPKGSNPAMVPIQFGYRNRLWLPPTKNKYEKHIKLLPSSRMYGSATPTLTVTTPTLTATTPTLTATLSPPGTLKIEPELLLTPPPWKPPFDSSQRLWISWCPDALSFWAAL